MNKVAVIICAAGASARFGGSRKKPFIEVANRPAFLRSIDFFAERDDVKQVILAISPEDDELVRLKWGANLSFSGVKLSYGDAERFGTVAKALELVDDSVNLIAVHDSVRCCLTKKWIDDVFQKAAQTKAAMLACPVVATLKKVDSGKIIDTIDRTNLFEAQTPQVFDAKTLKDAYKQLKDIPTDEQKTISDDAMLVEKLGKDVHIVETDNSNVKITRKTDVAIAEAIIKARPKPKPKGPQGPYIEAQW